MIINPGVVLADQIQMLKARKRVAGVFELHGLTLYITSSKESTRTHGPGSLHPFGFAEDYDSDVDISEELGQQIAKEVRLALKDDRYDVIWHNGHLHVEFDDGFQEWK